MVSTSHTEITPHSGTLANSEILARSSSGIGRSARHSSASGMMPISRSFCTLCWVGLVFSSPAAAIHGTRSGARRRELFGPIAQAHLAHRFEEGQRLDVADRAADLDDRDVDIVVVPMPAPRLMNSWISLVTCGITCTVLPR